MATKTNFSGVAARPMMSWAETWESPLKNVLGKKEEKIVKKLSRSVKLKSKARVFNLGKKFSKASNLIRGKRGAPGNTTASVLKSNSRLNELGVRLDMYL